MSTGSSATTGSHGSSPVTTPDPDPSRRSLLLATNLAESAPDSPASTAVDASKRRRLNLKACDPCFKRKTKCDELRPCHNCVAHGRQCTDARERKKSGPKQTHPTILSSINSLGNVLDSRPPTPLSHTLLSMLLLVTPSVPVDTTDSSTKPKIKSETSPTADRPESPLPSPGQSGAPSTSATPLTFPSEADRFYKPSPVLLIENMNAIATEPIVLELLRPLTVPLLVLNHDKHCQFLRDLLGENADKDEDIRVMDFHEDSISLSRLMLIFTLNLLITEIFIKLKKQKFRDFTTYPRRNLMRNYKNYKSLCHFKCIEIMALLEKNFIVPAVVPQKLVRQSSIMLANQHQVYYNLSLSYLHVCQYYHMMNLVNTLNQTSSNARGSDPFFFGNEAQEQHKILNLQKSISYFELILVKKLSGLSAMSVQLLELFEVLYTVERVYVVYSSGLYPLLLTRNNDIFTRLKSVRLIENRAQNSEAPFASNLCFELMHFLEQSDDNLLEKICHSTSFGALPRVAQSESESESRVFLRRKQLVEQVSVDLPILLVLKLVLVFKLVLVHRLEIDVIEREMIGVVTRLAHLLKNAASDLLMLQVSNRQILPPILHAFKIVLEYRAQLFHTISDEVLLEFSDTLLSHFVLFNNISKLVKLTPVLGKWFDDLNYQRLTALMAQLQQKKPSLPPPPQQSQQIHTSPNQPTPIKFESENTPLREMLKKQAQSLGLDESLVRHGSENSNNNNNDNSNNSESAADFRTPVGRASPQYHPSPNSPQYQHQHQPPPQQFYPTHQDQQYQPYHNAPPPLQLHHVHHQPPPPPLNKSISSTRHFAQEPALKEKEQIEYHQNNQHLYPELKPAGHALEPGPLKKMDQYLSELFDKDDLRSQDPEYDQYPRHFSLLYLAPGQRDDVLAGALPPSAYSTVDPTFDERDAMDAFRQQQEFVQYVEEGEAEPGLYSNIARRLSGDSKDTSHRRVVFGSNSNMSGMNLSNSSSSANMANAYIAMSESTKNLYSLFSKLGDHGSRGPSLTNLSLMAEYYGDVPGTARASSSGGGEGEDDNETSGFWI